MDSVLIENRVFMIPSDAGQVCVELVNGFCDAHAESPLSSVYESQGSAFFSN